MEIWHSRSKVPLQENHVYSIKYFRVLSAKPTYRATRHSCMLQFTPYTKIEEVQSVPAAFPLYAHDAVPFETLHTRINNDQFVSDTIAILTSCSSLKQQRTRTGASKSLRNLMITDGGETISVGLWGKHAEDFDADMCIEKSRNGSVVILFCAMTCRRYNDKLSLHSSLLCRWFINPPLPEADQLRQNSPNVPVQLLVVPQQPPDAEPTTVTELAVMNPHIVHDKRFFITAKIKEVSTAESWWYLACTNCNKKMYDSGDSLKCNNAICSSITGKPRYRLIVRAIEPHSRMANTGDNSIGLVFFGPHAEQIIGYPVEDIIEKSRISNVQIPKEIASVCGRAYNLRVSVGGLSFQDPSRSYQVISVVGAALEGLVGAPESAAQNNEKIPSAKEQDQKVEEIVSTPVRAEMQSRKRGHENVVENACDTHVQAIDDKAPKKLKDQDNAAKHENVPHKRNASTAKRSLNFDQAVINEGTA